MYTYELPNSPSNNDTVYSVAVYEFESIQKSIPHDKNDETVGSHDVFLDRGPPISNDKRNKRQGCSICYPRVILTIK